MKTRDIVVYVGLAGVAYFLYKKFAPSLQSVSNAVNKTADAIAAPIANAYVALTSPSAPVPNGSVIMPDGSYFPAANLSQYSFQITTGGTGWFSKDGQQYVLAPHDANGNYRAGVYSGF